MHLIKLDSVCPMMVNTRFECGDDPWVPPVYRIQVRTGDDAGVILEFEDLRSLRFFAAAAHSLLDAQRTHDAARKARPLTRPTPIRFKGF